MFSGIVEAKGTVTEVVDRESTLGVVVSRPAEFTDIKAGDSIAMNGVCLTVVEFDREKMRFDLGPETLKITGWTAQSLLLKAVNLERSLQVNSRMHGHFVAGHVDEMGIVQSATAAGDSLVLTIGFSEAFLPYVWKKGSVAVNGVSLTVNSVVKGRFEVTLIPETLRRTNLGSLVVGNLVTLEADSMARGLVNFLKNREA